ncbi:3887_t:CDS:1 [Funneliformis geosporum]|uniref:Sulfite reductase [NADPH] subunit beta n=1 Tax=Funneliformis geosporum TaxID=1117311 RepID=A0A9W4SG27_9GLOM|nr:3887_t:CDS:1 [Funneliformis geosporum]
MATTSEVVASRIAYSASDLIYVIEPNSPKSSSSKSQSTLELTQYQTQSKTNIFNKIPELETLHSISDPFSKLHVQLSKGSLISVIIPSNCSKNVLINSIPHLYKISNGNKNNQGGVIVIHVALDKSDLNQLGDYTDVMALRQTGFALLHSSGPQESSDMALIAHSIALKTGISVIHFFDNESKNESKKGGKIKILGNNDIKKLIVESDVQKYRDTLPNDLYFRSYNGISSSADSSDDQQDVSNANGEISVPTTTNGKQQSSPADFFTITEDIFETFKQLTNRSYKIIEFFGDKRSDSIIITMGSGAVLLQKVFEKPETSKIGLLKIRLYRPWSDKHLFAGIPKSVKKVSVLEQVVPRTTNWTPLYLDVVSAFQNRNYWSDQLPLINCGQYGALEKGSIDAEVTILLNSNFPRRNFFLGKEPSKPQSKNYGEVNGQDDLENSSALERPYIKMLNEIFSERLYIANSSSKPNAGHLEVVKSTPEFGFGVLLAKLHQRVQLVDLVTRIVKDTSIPEPLHEQLSKWLLHKDDAELSKKYGDQIAEMLSSEPPKQSSLAELLQLRNLFVKPAQWLIGSDAWAYDIGNSGVHHVISSGKDINMLIIDSQPYSTRTAADPDKRKKDIGLYAMNYGNVFVASVAMYSSYTQVLHALIEAEKFKGPSIVLAYLPYHSEKDTTITVLKETKLAVDNGYWPLYRWNPELEKAGKEPFILDSERIKQELQSFLDRENHLTQLIRSRPDYSPLLTNSLESEVKSRQKSLAKSAYEKLLGGLTGPPLLILFGSDNGNAEGLARRLQKGAIARGINARCLAMDDFPIEDITLEKNLVFICSTAGQGEFPQNARDFWKHISTTTDISFTESRYTVFGLGDSHYWPREEDAIYYNKPGKDLDARLELLGGQSLVPLGLGDDQDADGYETAYQAWEPELWKALGVELLGTIVEEQKKTDDDMKTESNFLRGTIAEGLEDTSTGALCERDTKLTKFHGIYQQDDRDLREDRKAQGLEKAFSFMVRVRVPGGVSTVQQWLAMDEIAEKYGSGSLKLTTRQAFQLHGVLKRNLREAIRGINRCLLDTLAACGDVNRNVMCNPNPLISEVHAEVQDFAMKISAHLSPRTSAYHEIWLDDKMVAGQAVQDFEPLYGHTYLPRKFKIAIAMPPNNDVDVFAHDLGYIVISDDNGKLLGYNVTVGGGMGMTHNNKKTYPNLGQLLGFSRPDQAIEVGEKVMLVQRDFGDRINRKHARLKYTIDDRDLDWFRNEVESRLGYKLDPPKEYKFENNADRYGWTKGVDDKWHFCMYIENGRVVDSPGEAIKTGLREIAKVHKGDFRLTPNQHLILGNVSEQDKPQIEELLKKYKLDNLKFTGLRLNSMSCVALPTCGLAMAESERYLPTLVSKLEIIIEECGLRGDAITIRMTGCPNGCARPYVAEIACVGKALGTYNLYLGGGFYGQRLNKLYKESLKEEDILGELKPMLSRYAKERNDGERFGDFVIRMGYVKATNYGKDFHDL